MVGTRRGSVAPSGVKGVTWGMRMSQLESETMPAEARSEIPSCPARL
ncbi:MAG: hypothetical protein J6D54_10600 [Olsenella sp.]|nr:hypothetical protein [Olsenella sp.]